GGRHDGETVQDEPVPPANACLGHRLANAGLERGLLRHRRVEQRDQLDEAASRRCRPPGGRAHERQRQSGGREHEKTPTHGEKAAKSRRYTVPASGCGGSGRRARFRSVWGKPRGGSSPLIRIPLIAGKRKGVLRRPSVLSPQTSFQDLHLVSETLVQVLVPAAVLVDQVEQRPCAVKLA